MPVIFLFAFLLGLPFAQAHDAYLKLLDLYLPPGSFSKLAPLRSLQHNDKVLPLLAESFPELNFIILAASPKPYAAGYQVINWRDARLPVSVTDLYSQQKVFTETDHPRSVLLGGYLPAHSDLDDFPHRPLQDRPLLILHSNAPKDAVVHELLHHLIDEARLAKMKVKGVSYKKWLKERTQQVKRNFQLAKALNGLLLVEAHLDLALIALETLKVNFAEEIETSLYVVRNREKFGLSDLMVAHQVDYAQLHLDSLMNSLELHFQLIQDALDVSEASPTLTAKRLALQSGSQRFAYALGEICVELQRALPLLRYLSDPYYVGESPGECDGVFGEPFGG